MLISRRILDAAYRLDGLRLAEASPPPQVPAASRAASEPELPIVPVASLLYDDEPVVSLERRSSDDAGSPAESDVVPIESLAPDGGLEASFQTYDRLRRERAVPQPSLDALVGRALAATSPMAEETVTVEIGALCYRGRPALERAAAIRQQLADELARNGGLASIQPLLQELLDLVPLALAES
jgi:hypothetical protein